SVSTSSPSQAPRDRDTSPLRPTIVLRPLTVGMSRARARKPADPSGELGAAAPPACPLPERLSDPGRASRGPNARRGARKGRATGQASTKTADDTRWARAQVPCSRFTYLRKLGQVFGSPVPTCAWMV